MANIIFINCKIWIIINFKNLKKKSISGRKLGQKIHFFEILGRKLGPKFLFFEILGRKLSQKISFFRNFGPEIASKIFFRLKILIDREPVELFNILVENS